MKTAVWRKNHFLKSMTIGFVKIGLDLQEKTWFYLHTRVRRQRRSSRCGSAIVLQILLRNLHHSHKLVVITVTSHRHLTFIWQFTISNIPTKVYIFYTVEQVHVSSSVQPVWHSSSPRDRVSYTNYGQSAKI